MLLDELNIWHQFLDNLNKGTFQPEPLLSGTITEQRKKITEAWLSVAFSDAPDIALGRYFRFHQQEVRWFSSQLDTFSGTPEQKALAATLLQEVRELQNFLNRHFSRYLVPDENLEALMDKILVNVSVAQLGCMLKLAYETGLFPNITVSELIRSVVIYCRTRKQLHISARGLSKEYYSVTQVTAANCREILEQMIRTIDKIYFPT